MWAHALLTVLRAAAVEDELPKKGALLPEATRSLEAFRQSHGLSSA